MKKGVLRNFAKFAGKHLCQSLFFNKVAGLKTGVSILRSNRFIDRCDVQEMRRLNYFFKIIFITISVWCQSS